MFDSQLPLLHRRAALTAGAHGLLGLTFAKWLAAKESGGTDPQVLKRAGRAQSVIFLYQFGGPSHVDTFDIKPNAPEGIRSLFGQIDSAIPGIRVCEHLPRTARILDKVTLVRSVFHSMKNHNSASYHALTGYAPPVDDIRLKDSIELFPAYGSVVDKLAPNAATMPTFVALPHVIRDGSITPGQHASFLGKRHDPLLITTDPNADDFRLPELSLPPIWTPNDCKIAGKSNKSSASRRGCWSSPRRLAASTNTTIGHSRCLLRPASVTHSICLANRPRAGMPTAVRPTGKAACWRRGWSRQASIRQCLLRSEHRRPEHDERRLGHARLQRHTDVSDFESPSLTPHGTNTFRRC